MRNMIRTALIIGTLATPMIAMADDAKKDVPAKSEKDAKVDAKKDTKKADGKKDDAKKDDAKKDDTKKADAPK